MTDVICLHTNFKTFSRVGRLTDSEGIVTSYSADIRINCTDCGQPFIFLGLPMGYFLNGAAISVDGQEGRFSIAPARTEGEKPKGAL